MPNMTPLSICARTVSGLTTVPQSTAQTTRRTRTAPSLGHFDFGDMRHVGREHELERDAAAGPRGQGLAPAGLLRREREDRLGARRLVEQREPVGDRILLRGRRKLVHEAFDHEDGVRRPDAAPERRRNPRRLDPQILDMEVRQRVGEVDRALGRVRIEAVLEPGREIARDHRGAGETMGPGNRHAFFVEPGGEPVEPVGPVHVVLDVFLAGPHDLHGAVDVLCDLRPRE